ncbi:11824_t:CDS:2 [Diversispora eburnea]|uniref:11824_t:CDS:1 n=1 Tax=Diversispora eburnea TaxID=1213867 RepID=A0A9N8Z6G1_9GLOM|nr:11824_t:CDS:2 [Diversispora eburnea]
MNLERLQEIKSGLRVKCLMPRSQERELCEDCEEEEEELCTIKGKGKQKMTYAEAVKGQMQKQDETIERIERILKKMDQDVTWKEQNIAEGSGKHISWVGEVEKELTKEDPEKLIESAKRKTEEAITEINSKKKLKGASDSFASEELIERIGIPVILGKEKLSVGGEKKEMTIRGEAEIEGEMQGYIYREKVLIETELQFEIIIGIRKMKEEKWEIKFGQTGTTIRIKNGENEIEVNNTEKRVKKIGINRNWENNKEVGQNIEKYS